MKLHIPYYLIMVVVGVALPLVLVSVVSLAHSSGMAALVALVAVLLVVSAMIPELSMAFRDNSII